MDISTKHDDARKAASRIPGLNASLALLVEDTAPAQIDFYGTVRPDPGDPPGDDPVVTIVLGSAAGAVDDEAFQLLLTVPIEAQITGAGGSGTEVLWARITDGAGDWFADASVSDEAGSGEAKIQTTTLYNGAFVRLTSAVLQG